MGRHYNVADLQPCIVVMTGGNGGELFYTGGDLPAIDQEEARLFPNERAARTVCRRLRKGGAGIDAAVRLVDWSEERWTNVPKALMPWVQSGGLPPKPVFEDHPEGRWRISVRDGWASGAGPVCWRRSGRRSRAVMGCRTVATVTTLMDGGAEATVEGFQFRVMTAAGRRYRKAGAYNSADEARAAVAALLFEACGVR